MGWLGGEGALVSDEGPEYFHPIHTVVVPALDSRLGLSMLEMALGPQRIAAENQAAGEIVRWCEGLPLALRILAARLTLRPDLRLSEMAEWLRDDQRRLAEFRVGERDLAARIRSSYARLNPDGQLLFRRMALLASSGADEEALTQAMDASPADVQFALDSLVHAYLVHVAQSLHEGGRVYRQPLLMRDVARELLLQEREEPATYRSGPR